MQSVITSQPVVGGQGATCRKLCHVEELSPVWNLNVTREICSECGPYPFPFLPQGHLVSQQASPNGDSPLHLGALSTVPTLSVALTAVFTHRSTRLARSFMRECVAGILHKNVLARISPLSD